MPKIIENVREKIIEAAYNLFIQEGYEQVKTGRIARECGIAAGTLFNYFPTKWDLLREILEKVKEYSLQEFLISIEEKPCGYERLYFAVSGLFYIINRIGKLGKDFFIYILSLDQERVDEWKQKDPETEKLLLKSFLDCYPELSNRSTGELKLLLKSFEALVVTAYTADESLQSERKHFVCSNFVAMIKDSKKYIKEG